MLIELSKNVEQAIHPLLLKLSLTLFCSFLGVHSVCKDSAHDYQVSSEASLVLGDGDSLLS